MKDEYKPFILIVFAFVTIGIAVLLPMVLVNTYEKKARETYIPLIEKGEAIITIHDGIFTAKIFGPDVTEYSSANFTEVLQWGIQHTKIVKDSGDDY
jgi:hypothetical protein